MEFINAFELAGKVKRGNISVIEIAELFNKKAKKCQEECNAFISLTPDICIKQAERIDEKIRKNEPLGLLAGVPLAVKDNIAVEGVRLSCASRILKDFISPYNATVIDRIIREDALIIGKTNLDEFAMGSSTEYSSFGYTKNPLDLSRVPGGSSGGSAAAVSYGASLLALGSDTGGSIRQPAAFCGIIGLKPTYGLVSRYGLVAFASSLDQIGPFGKNVIDIALLLTVIQGRDTKDSTSSTVIPEYPSNFLEWIAGKEKNKFNPGIRKWRIGIPNEYLQEGIEESIRKIFDSYTKKLSGYEIEFVNISLPLTQYGISAYYIVATAEASSNLARYDGIRYGTITKDAKNMMEVFTRTRTEGFGEEVKRRIMLGTYVLKSGYYDAYYLKALKIRTLLKRELDKAFESCDFILTPTTPSLPFRFGEKLDDPITMYMSDILTVASNLTGMPSISIPVKSENEKLPAGIQLIGEYFSEPMLLSFSRYLELINEES